MKPPDGYEPMEKAPPSIGDFRDLLATLIEVANSKDALKLFGDMVAESDKTIKRADSNIETVVNALNQQIEGWRQQASKYTDMMGTAVAKDAKSAERVEAMLAENRKALEKMAANGEATMNAVVDAVQASAETNAAILAAMREIGAGIADLKKPRKVRFDMERQEGTELLRSVVMETLD